MHEYLFPRESVAGRQVGLGVGLLLGHKGVRSSYNLRTSNLQLVQINPILLIEFIVVEIVFVDKCNTFESTTLFLNIGHFISY